ncbi:MAG TPA: heavy metal transporter [Lachnospiraceae bacterium]|nr:heavy metal transporter [Lachnospiraceae bacterium]
MKKKFKIEDLCCAHCAGKIEEAIKQLDGVNDASVSIITEKMMIDADDEKFDDIVKEAVAIAAKIEPECTIHVK